MKMLSSENLFLLFAGCLALCIAGCTKSNSTIEDTEDLYPTSVDAAGSDQDSISVPDGTPEELFEFITEISRAEPENDDPEVTGEHLRRVMTARLKACNKILASDAPPDLRTGAVQFKLESLRTLSVLDPEGLGQEYDPYVESLIESNDPYLARVAKASRFQALVDDFASSPGQDPANMMTELRTLLAEQDAGPSVLAASRDAAIRIFQAQHTDLAAQAFQLIGERFKDHPDENLAKEGQGLLAQARHVVLQKLAFQVLDNQAGSTEKLVTELDQLLSAEDINASLGFAMQTAQMLEFSGNYQPAQQVYDMILAKYKGQDTDTAQQVAESVSLASQRLALLGKPLEIEGTFFDGSSFEWESYRGKVVLLDFWATWCQPCLAEVDNIRENYAKHHENGFEVIGINLDDHRSELERFFASNKLPWGTLVNEDTDAVGFENPNAVRCAVEAIPFLALIDRDGIVRHIHVLGERLDAELDALMQEGTTVE